MLKELKLRVFNSNLDLPKYKLVTFTWGNVSGIDREEGLVVIKPSGVPYDELSPDDMVVVDLDGKIVEGKLKPSSDLPTHLVFYKHFKEIGGVVHTHSPWATSFAQAGLNLPALGTTHADYFSDNIPCTRKMTKKEIHGEYEKETGNVVIELYENINPLFLPGVLVNMHGPFTWGKTPEEALHNSVVLEEVAKMAHRTLLLNPNISKMDKALLEKHFYRKHGDKAYYGQ